MAPHEKNLAMQAMRMGQEMPSRIANAPQLQIGLQLFLQAFLDLDTDRQAAMSVLPIPYSSIWNYTAAFELDDEQTADVFYHVRSMDNFYLKWFASKNKSQ